MSYDVIILGLGAMGSAAALHLARRGVRVLGIEQFTPPHDRGSSHAGSRIIRQAYFESPDYIPLVLRAYELWHALERDSKATLLHTTGGIVIGSSHGDLVSRTIAAARRHAIPIDVLEPSDIARTFPAFTPQPEDVGVYEPLAGYLLPEECIRAHLRLASNAGAELHFEERAGSWSSSDKHVELRTDRATYSAGHLIITAGPWANEALHSLFPLRVTRQVVAWIQPRSGVELFLAGKFPIYIAEDLNGGYPAYGFPAIDGLNGGIKAAIHGSNTVCAPDTVDRSTHPEDIQRIIDALKPRIPAIDGIILRAQTCLYTMTPDEHFIIGPHPQLPACTIACGFSGHGFKFAPAVGEILADLSTTGATTHPTALFSPDRFSR